MAVTIDSRTHIIGDLMLISGTWENGDTSIDVSSHLSSVIMAFVAPTNASEQANPVGIVGTTIHFTESAAHDGIWSAIGKR